MKQLFESVNALFKSKMLISLLAIILLLAGVSIYWRLWHRNDSEMLNVGGRENACTCSQRLNQ